MKTIFFTKTAICAAALAALSCSADVVLPEIFASHMVLQRDSQVPLWGTASAGEQVSVKFNGQEQSAQADKYGKWKVEFVFRTTQNDFWRCICGNERLNNKRKTI